MLSVVDHGAPAPCPAPFNLAAHVLARGQAQPDKIALQVLRPGGSERWSYARLIAAVRGVGTGLMKQGLAPGDRILLCLGNTVEFPVGFLGAIAAGLIPVPVSAQLTRPELTRIIADIVPARIIAAEAVPLPGSAQPVLQAPDLRAMAALPPCDWAMGDPDRLAYMIYTSGTSGNPRAVMHAHRAIWARRMMIAHWSGLTETDRMLHAGAFNWTYTLGAGLLDPWAVGATALIPGDGVTPQHLGLLAARHDATVLAAAPGVFRQMLRAQLPALPRLRHALSAGEKLPDALRDAWAATTGTPVLEALGLSECSTFISSPADDPAPAGAIGRPQPGRRVAVIGTDGAVVPCDAPGTLAVHRSDQGLFLGYLDAPQETMARFCGDWFLTGDVVRMDATGAITFLGRDDDMMNAGGFRVSPLEVETAIAAHPGVTEAAATEVTVKDGVSVIACFYTAPAPADVATLTAHAAATLARYKQPRLFIHVPTLPRGRNTKINRRALRAQWQADHDPT